MAYSSKIDDQAFDRYRRNTNNWNFLFALILAIVVISGFYLYGKFSNEMDNPEALFIGMGIGFMFLLIGMFAGKSRYTSQNWDGKVIDKKKTIRTKDIGYSGVKAERQVFTVFIKSESGKIFEIRSEDDDTVYNYYKTGDKVRYHGSLNSYEKYDKSGDDIIFCNACAFMHDINDSVCRNCGCPLLK